MSNALSNSDMNRTVRDMMIPLDSYPHISSQAPLSEAVSVFTGAQIERRGRLSLPRVLLVFDENDELVGTVRRRDIMRGLMPKFFSEEDPHQTQTHFEQDPTTDHLLTELFRDSEHKLLSGNADEKVEVVIQPISDTIEADSDLIELVKVMMKSEGHFLPVMEDGHVTGVVRSVEVLNQIRRLLKAK